tara:strand:- start:386 stop:1912 length:1527 start_codon:yes stop_codon:yes gene_type:complete
VTFSPADLNLYLRVSGDAYPDTPQKMMAIAPKVHNFTRNFGRGGYVEQQPNVLKDLAGNVGKLALLGLGAGLVSGLAADGSTKTSVPATEGSPTTVEGPEEQDFPTQTVAEELQGRMDSSPAGRMPEKIEYDDPLVKDAVEYLEASENIDTPNSSFVDSVSVDPEGEINVATFPSVDNTQDKRARYAENAGLSGVVDQYLYNQLQIQDSDPPEVRQFKAHKLEDIIQQTKTASELGGVGSVYNDELRNNAFFRTSIGKGTDAGVEPGGTVAIYPQSRFNNNDTGSGGAVAVDGGPMSPETVIDGKQGSNMSSLAPSAYQALVESGEGGSLQKDVEGFLSDWNQGVKWGETFDNAMTAGSPVKGAGIVAGAVAQKGAGDVITRGKKIVEQVPKTIKKVGEGIQEVKDVILHEQIKASTFAEAARINAGLPPLLGDDVVEVGKESDLSDNAQIDDFHQQNEQATPAGLNRQNSNQKVVDLANTLGKGLAHLSPEARIDLARKMIESENNL